MVSLGVAANGYLYFLRLSYLEQGAETAIQNEQMIQELRAKRQTDQFVGWQVYRNKEYGFEFKYPEETKVSEVNSKEFFGNPVGTHILEGWADKHFEIFVNYDWAVFTNREGQLKQEEVEIDGIKGIKFINYLGNGCTISYILIDLEYNKNLFFHNLVECPTHPEGVDAQMNQILSTFRFIR